MRKKGAWKYGLLFGLLALLLVGLLIVELQDRASKSLRSQVLERAEPLERRRDELISRRDQLQRSYYERSQGIATEQMLFLDLDPLLMEELFPLMEERELVGVLGLREGNLPGDPGRISRSDFDRLLAAGWETCLVCEDSGDFAAWDRDMGELLRKAGIEKPRAVYFPEKNYDPALHESILAGGYTVAVHHGEGQEPVIAGSAEGDLWLCSAHPWNYVGVKEEINTLVRLRDQQCFTLRFSPGREEYEQDAFVNMLNYIQPFREQNTLAVTGLLQARDLHDPEKNGLTALREQWEREDEELERQILELNREIHSVYSEWSGNDD